MKNGCYNISLADNRCEGFFTNNLLIRSTAKKFINLFRKYILPF